MIQNLAIISIPVLILLSTCQRENKEENPLALVDIEANIDKMEIVNLSQFTDNIRYLTLEKIKDLPLVGLNHIDFLDNLILVDNGNICLLYDTSGHYISKIGSQGRGPGEYLGIMNMGLGEQKEIYISVLYDLLEYNISGAFLKKYPKSLLINNKYIMRTWYPIDDSLFIGQIPNSTGQIEYKAIIADKCGNIKQAYKNYILFKREREVAGGAEGFANFYHFEGSVYYKEIFNDTLFSLNDKYELVPRYYFNLGKLQMPVSEREKPMTQGKNWSYISLWDVFQTENYILMDCHFGNRFPAKRLTPKPSLNPGGGLVWINTNYVLGIFNKKTGEFTFCKPSDTDNELSTTGINNDIDCGPRFFPITMVNDSTLVMSVRADQLKAHIACEDFRNSVPKFPEKKKQLEDLANSLSDLDNPILMFVTFKK